MRWGCALYAFFVLLTHVSAYAYERDVHYDLTKYLVRWAGFSEGKAEQIATADQELDTKPEFNPLPNQITCLKPLELAGVVAALLTIPKACKDDPEFQRMLTAQRAYHFVDGKRLQELRDSAFRGKNLKVLGHYLHALQDTFAHSLMDYKDLPPLDKLVASLGFLPDEKIIGHLLYGHSADKTSERPDLAEFMARYVYTELAEFQGSANRWNDVEAAVVRFVNAKDGQKKLGYLSAAAPSQAGQALFPLPGSEGTSQEALKNPVVPNDGGGSAQGSEKQGSSGRTTDIITQALAGEQREVRYPNGQLRERGQVQQDKEGNFRKVGKWTFWHDNGQKSQEGTYRDGIEEGKWIFWHDNGQKSQEGTYRDGKKEGKWTFWHKSGHKKEEGTYTDGKRQGKWTSWYSDGMKRIEGEYRDGDADGHWTEYGFNGQKSSEGAFSGGKRIGKWTFWFSDGQKWKEGGYQNGVPTGRWIYWDPKGKEYEGTCLDGYPEGNWIIGGVLKDYTVAQFRYSAGQLCKP